MASHVAFRREETALLLTTGGSNEVRLGLGQVDGLLRPADAIMVEEAVLICRALSQQEEIFLGRIVVENL